MADKAEIVALVEETVKEQVKGLAEQMSLLMDMFKAQQQQQSSSSSQPTIPPLARQGLNLDKAPVVNTEGTLPFEDPFITGTNAAIPPVINSPQTNPVVEASNDESAKMLAKIDQRLREVEGSHHLSPIDFSIYAKVQVPDKFKMPDFEKYEGISNPIQHIQMYQSRMYKYISNGPFMVQTFQASLKDAAMRWYIDYNINRMENWEEAANAFVKHFRFNLDITVSREDLEQAEMKKGENLKQYATRWRNIASQLRPEPPERELMRLFVSTLPQAMRSRMVGTAAQSFSQLITMGEDIEIALKKGWLGDTGSVSRRPLGKKDKEPAPEVNVAYVQKAPAQTPRMQSSSYGHQNQRTFQRKPRQYTPLPGTVSQVLTILRKKGLLTSEPQRPNHTSFRNYDPSKKCDYHKGEPGHSTDECGVLKNRIQDLLETGAFALQQTEQPNVQNNPLPDHPGN